MTSDFESSRVGSDLYGGQAKASHFSSSQNTFPVVIFLFNASETTGLSWSGVSSDCRFSGVSASHTSSGVQATRRACSMASSRAAKAAKAAITSGKSATDPYRVLISGASGMLGSALQHSLSHAKPFNRFNPEIYTLVRHAPRSDKEIYWDPYEGSISAGQLEGFDAVVHLAGAWLHTRRLTSRVATPGEPPPPPHVHHRRKHRIWRRHPGGNRALDRA